MNLTTFLRLIYVSSIYGLLFFIPAELFVHVLFIGRITTIEFDLLLVIVSILSIILFIIGTIGVIHLTKRWFYKRLLRFWSALLWFPIACLYIYLFDLITPDLRPEDILSPGSGFVILFGAFLYPFYILVINAIISEDQA